MTGYKMEKSFRNINDFSSEGMIETDLELDSFGKENFYLFQVKKGF